MIWILLGQLAYIAAFPTIGALVWAYPRARAWLTTAHLPGLPPVLTLRYHRHTSGDR